MFIRRVLKPWVLKPFCPVAVAGAGAVVVAVAVASLTLAINLTSERAWGGVVSPRMGLEIEFSEVNENGPVVGGSLKTNFPSWEMKFLEFVGQIFGGHLSEGQKHKIHLDRSGDKWWFDREWVNERGTKDGIELVSPPLGPEKRDLLVANYDRIRPELKLGPGWQTSFQVNVELRELLDGFSISERPTEKWGIPFSDIKNVDVSKIIRWLLFLELNADYIYAATAATRMGDVYNKFSIPLYFNHMPLLEELYTASKGRLSYLEARRIFLSHHKKEEGFAGSGSPWKYRTFNIDKFFRLSVENPEWVYPALEIRLADTPEDAKGLRRILELCDSLFRWGVENSNFNESGFSGWISENHLKYSNLIALHGNKLSEKVIRRVIARDLEARLSHPLYRSGYEKFIVSLGLSQSDYLPFKGRRIPIYVSQTHLVHSDISKDNFSWQKLPVSKGAEFEFTPNASLEAQLKNNPPPYLDQNMTTEKATGNREVRTKPTAQVNEHFSRLNEMWSLLDNDLRSIHDHSRFPKDLIYERISQRKLKGWLGLISDWIVSLRILYRNSNYAFAVRTQSRMRIDIPDTWLYPNYTEGRGTVRFFEVGDEIDIEIRGLMDGIYEKFGPVADLHRVAHTVLLRGLNDPSLIPDDINFHRLLSEHVDPQLDLEKLIREIDPKSSLSTNDLLGSTKNADLMVLPLMGFEYLPMLSGQDIEAMDQATRKFKQGLSGLLKSKHDTQETVATEFHRLLVKWAQDSRFDHILFDVLLSRLAVGSGWADLNLPAPYLRSSFLGKILRLEVSGFDHPETLVFLKTWLTKGRESFIETVFALDEDSRLQLTRRLDSVNTRAQQQNLARALKIDFAAICPEFKQRDQLEAGELRNIDYLLGQVRPEAVVPSAKEMPSVEGVPSANEALPAETPIQGAVSGPPQEDTNELVSTLLEGERVPDWVTSESSLVKYLERVVDFSKEVMPFHQKILDETRVSMNEFIISQSKFGGQRYPDAVSTAKSLFQLTPRNLHFLTLSQLVHKFIDGRNWFCPSWIGTEYILKISQFMDDDERKVALVPLLEGLEVHRRAIANTKPSHSQEIVKIYKLHGSAAFFRKNPHLSTVQNRNNFGRVLSCAGVLRR
ncbi:MAG: hypothetical protein IPL83_12365 [Bdellovibrionales bacterium]|nr:hypothetical protein [Bdellovibrionales bacterium]